MKQSRLDQDTKKALDRQADSLDSQTLQHLRVARENALAQHHKRSYKTAKWLTGAGVGLALASVLTFMLVPNLMSSNKISPFDDLEILTTESELDLYTQLEFYEWLGDSLDEG